MQLTDLQKISSTLRRNAVPPMKVMNSEEAKKMTANDPTGHAWQVGEEYYQLEYRNGKVEFKSF